MKKNMGTADRIVRIIIAIILGVLIQQGIITGLLGTILSVLAIVFLLTSIVSYCPLYQLVGIKTCPMEKN